MSSATEAISPSSKDSRTNLQNMFNNICESSWIIRYQYNFLFKPPFSHSSNISKNDESFGNIEVVWGDFFLIVNVTF